MAAKITLQVIKKEQVTEKVFFVTFRPVTPPSIPFRAGQNMMLMVAPGVNRTMSIASPPSAHDILMVHDVSPMGPGSQWTVGLQPGDHATIVAPTGGALSFLDTPKRKVMVATGTGIAPFHSMIADALEKKKNSPMTLYWGLRYEQDIYWHDEFLKMTTLNSSFMFHLILSKPNDKWRGLAGHVTEHVLRLEKDLLQSEFYLCGSKAMTEEVKAKLLEKNVPKDQINTELFY